MILELISGGFMKRAFIIISVVLFILMLSTAAYAETPNINAPSYILIDSKTGQILYEKNPNEKLYPASATKIMTAILALEKGNLDQLMTASQAAVYEIGVGGSNIGIMAGEEVRLEDLLNAMLMKSANETANIVAENLAPSRREFVEMMNKRALELGAVNTNYVNPCGLFDPNHYTTVSDFSKIARYAMTLPKFREIVCKETYKMPPTNMHSKWDILPTTNKILKSSSSFYTGMTGIKTGYTSQAGYSFVASAVNNDGMELIGIILSLKTPSADRDIFNFSKELLECGFRNFSIQKFVDDKTVITNVPVMNSAQDESLDLVTAGELTTVLPNEKIDWNIKGTVNININAIAPIKEGEILGYIDYERNGYYLGRLDLAASKSIAENVESRFAQKSQVFKVDPLYLKTLVIIILLIALYLGLKYYLHKSIRYTRIKSDEE